MSIKPILFNTETARAILDRRKTMTRRVVKPQPGKNAALLRWDYGMPVFEDGTSAVQPCRPGDILYVRETWAQANESMGMGLKRKRYIYRANYSNTEAEGWKWRPSIHMPKEAARLFLRVTDVRVERLHKIKADECVSEGAVKRPDYTKRHDLVLHNRYRKEFAELWDSTIKPADRDRYGWAASPWVWVIAFERCEKPEGWPK